MFILKDTAESSFSSLQFVIIIHGLLKKRKSCVIFAYFFILAIASPFSLKNY